MGSTSLSPQIYLLYFLPVRVLNPWIVKQIFESCAFACQGDNSLSSAVSISNLKVSCAADQDSMVGAPAKLWIWEGRPIPRAWLGQYGSGAQTLQSPVQEAESTFVIFNLTLSVKIPLDRDIQEIPTAAYGVKAVVYVSKNATFFSNIWSLTINGNFTCNLSISSCLTCEQNRGYPDLEVQLVTALCMCHCSANTIIPLFLIVAWRKSHSRQCSCKMISAGRILLNGQKTLSSLSKTDNCL